MASMERAVRTAPKIPIPLALLTTKAARPALKAVPFKIPRCSLDASGSGVVWVSARALEAVYVDENDVTDE
jgi:hypothetical protein